MTSWVCQGQLTCVSVVFPHPLTSRERRSASWLLLLCFQACLPRKMQSRPLTEREKSVIIQGLNGPDYRYRTRDGGISHSPRDMCVLLIDHFKEMSDTDKKDFLDAQSELGLEADAFYDTLTVLESVGVVERTQDEMVVWKGLDCISMKMAKLRYMSHILGFVRFAHEFPADSSLQSFRAKFTGPIPFGILSQKTLIFTMSEENKTISFDALRKLIVKNDDCYLVRRYFDLRMEDVLNILEVLNLVRTEKTIRDGRLINMVSYVGPDMDDLAFSGEIELIMDDLSYSSQLIDKEIYTLWELGLIPDVNVKTGDLEASLIELATKEKYPKFWSCEEMNSRIREIEQSQRPMIDETQEK